MGVIPDQPAALEGALLDAAASADVILTSGGVSVGEADFIKALLLKLGDVAFWKINIKPGRPMAFGKIGNTLLFGLPGNPVAVMVTYYQFVLDALLALMGVTPCPNGPCSRPNAPAVSASCRAAANSSAPACSEAVKAGRSSPLAPRAPACCARCRKRTASSCCPKRQPTSKQARW